MFGLGKSLRVVGIMKFSKLVRARTISRNSMPSLLDAQSAPKRLTIANLIYLCVCTENCAAAAHRVKKKATVNTATAAASSSSNSTVDNNSNSNNKIHNLLSLALFLPHSVCASITQRLTPFSICYQHYSISTIYFSSHLLSTFFFHCRHYIRTLFFGFTGIRFLHIVPFETENIHF